MADNEIIKALEKCLGDYCYTSECYFFKNADTGACWQCAIRHALDLIQQKDTEIAILLRKKEALRDEIEELQGKNSELEIELKEMRLWDGLQKAEIEKLSKDRYWINKDGELTLLPRTE